MANMQTECLNIKCSNKVTDGAKWCCIKCKEAFLLDNYDSESTIKIMKEHSEDFKERQKKVLAEIKESGLSIFEFLKTLGEFKDDEPEKELQRLEKPKAKAGDYIKIDEVLGLVVEKGTWEMELCKGNLAVVILKFASGKDWMEMAHWFQEHFEKGKYKIIPKEEALRRLAE